MEAESFVSEILQGEWKESQISHSKEGTPETAAFTELTEAKGGTKEIEKDFPKEEGV